VIFISKFGYTWHPFHEFCTLGNFRSAPVPAFFSAFYRPLLALDRQWWHTEMKAESGDYRVKPVFSIAGKTGTARVPISEK
jgi:hypothetical protein